MRRTQTTLAITILTALVTNPLYLNAAPFGFGEAKDEISLAVPPARTYFPSADYSFTPHVTLPLEFAPVAIAPAPPTRLMLETAVEVAGQPSDNAVDEGFTSTITPGEVETSAGTFGDLSRFMQTLAGVVSDNDQRNDFLVRGGNPSENLFVIDNIDVPSINQLALSDTTGGFVSMLDASAIQSIQLHTDAYDDRFDQRLSSVLDVSTRTSGPVAPHNTTEIGLAGMGGSITRPLGQDGSYFFSVRRGVLQYITNNIGMDGVPHYTNSFFRAEQRLDARNSVWGMSLTGVDSIQISPAFYDAVETEPYDITYNGWRNSTGINWQHIFSDHASGTASLAHAAQHQSVLEDGQLEGNATVYNENTTDNTTTLKYDFVFQANSRITLTSGASSAVDQLNYAVAQPIGLVNPYSSSPTPLDAGGMSRRFADVASAAYVQGAISLPLHSTLVLGERAEQWSLGGHAGATSKALYSVPVFGHLAHVGYAELQQMPPTLYLLSFNNINTLKPIRSRQLTAGVTLADNPRARITLEAYQKNYSDYPVALNYPQLSLANIADTFGTAFLMFPMTAQGTGLARGVELTVQTHVTSNLNLSGTLTYARSRFAGLDGVLRPGNYDIPLQANINGVWRMPHRFTASWRYTITSGVPYTPDNMALSYAQNRDIYDLTQVNAVRAPAYRRLDFRIEKTHNLGFGQMTWHIGLENALNDKNFYDLLWQHNIGGQSEQTQMPRFPDGGIKYVF